MDAQGLRLITALKLCILATKKDGTPLYSDREQYIFSELYGLEGNEIQNMISLGDKLGLSRERIRQLKVKVFKKFGILRKRNIPAIIDIDNLLTNNHQINLDEVHNFACYLKKFQESHLSEYPIETLFDLAQLYFKQDYSIIKTWKREIKETSTIFPKKQNSQLTDITNKIIWFDHVKSWTLEEIHQITPHRNYDPNKKYLESEAGEFYSNKLQRNVFYESMLEKKFYKRLEKSHEVIYYVEQGITITYDRGKYTPDAIVFLDDGKGFVVEIKPLTEMANQSVQKKFKALLDFCEETGLGATLTDGRTDINHIFETIPNLAFEESILQSLKEFKKLTYGKVKELKNKYQVTTIHLLQCIIKNNLSYNSMPTFIWKTKKPIICDLLLSPENKMLLKGSTDIINNDKT